jgi:TolB protein
MKRLVFVWLVCFLIGCAGTPTETSSPLSQPTFSPLAIPGREMDGSFVVEIDSQVEGMEEGILFSSTRGGNRGFFLSDTQGKRIFPIVINEELSLIGTADWSTANQQLVFGAEHAGRVDLFYLDFETQELLNLTEDTPYGGQDPVWSPNGSRIAYVCSPHKPEICLIDADGSNFHQVTEHPSIDLNVTWSPEGDQIAYQTSRSGLSGIYVVDLSNYEETDLTGGKSQFASPSWSPDGERITCHSDQDGTMSIFTIDVDSSEKVNRTPEEGADVGAIWAPSEEKIAFRSKRNGTWELFVKDMRTGSVENITPGYGAVTTYSWAPDGKSLVFNSDVAGSDDVYIVSIGNGDITRLTNDENSDVHPMWIDIEL